MKKLLLILCVLPLFWACGNDDEPANVLTVEKDKITLFHDEVINLKAKNTNGSPINYKSEDELTATVDDKGNVKGWLIGKTNIIVEDNSQKKIIPVIVKPQYTTFTEEIAPFGSSIETVMNIHKGIKVVSDKENNNERTILFRYDNYGVGYKLVNNKVTFMTYVTSISQIGNTSEIIGFLAERYIPVKQEGGNKYFFTTKDKKTIILMGVEYDGGISILFSPIEK